MKTASFYASTILILLTGSSWAFQILTPSSSKPWHKTQIWFSASGRSDRPLFQRGWELQEKQTDDGNLPEKIAISESTVTSAMTPNDNEVETLSAEEEYRKRLEEAQTAFAKAEEARQKLLRQQQEKEKAKFAADDETLVTMDLVNTNDAPKLTVDENDMAMLSPFSRAEISYTDALTLEITLPPQNMGMNTLLSGAFSVAWFSAITPATFAARGLASFMFMLPFWIAGGAVAKAGVVDPLVRQKFTLGQYAWSLTKEIAGQTIQKVDRPTERLRGVKLRVIDYVNEIPRYELQLQLNGQYDKKNNDYSFGLWVGEENLDEAKELLQVINRQLKKFEVME
jgi:hypothetical protein